MSKTIGIIIAIVVVVGGIYLFTRGPATPTDTGTGSQQESSSATAAQGRVVFSVTDAAANMSTISEINMQVSKVDVHSSAKGWMTVSTTPKVYSLLALNQKSESQVLADVNMEAGTYDQVRLTVDSIAVKEKDGSTEEAKMPSGELRINTMLKVNANKTSSVNLDFMADKSLHVTGSGKYIFAPVVKTESKSNAEVNVDTNSVVTISGGNTDSANTVGMDIDGSVKLDFQINSKQKLNIDATGVIKLEGALITN